MPSHILGHILVEGGLNVHHFVLVGRSMEDGEIDDEGVAFARNYILGDHLVAARVDDLSKVGALW